MQARRAGGAEQSQGRKGSSGICTLGSAALRYQGLLSRESPGREGRKLPAEPPRRGNIGHFAVFFVLTLNLAFLLFS